MTLGYPTGVMILGLKGQRSRLWLGLTAIQRGFELYECLLVVFVAAMVSVWLLNALVMSSHRGLGSVFAWLSVPHRGQLRSGSNWCHSMSARQVPTTTLTVHTCLPTMLCAMHHLRLCWRRRHESVFSLRSPAPLSRRATSPRGSGDGL